MFAKNLRHLLLRQPDAVPLQRSGHRYRPIRRGEKDQFFVLRAVDVLVSHGGNPIISRCAATLAANSATLPVSVGSGFREVVLTVMESDGFYEAEQEYKCVFADSLAMFGMGHSASIHQLKVHDAVYGKEGDQILGTYDEHLKLTQTVDAALAK